MRKVIPILIIVGIIAAAAIYLGPGLYRAYLLRQSNQALLEAARAGDVTKLASLVEPDQQQDLQAILNKLLPQNYPHYIQSLKVLNIRAAGASTSWAMVSCRMESDAGTAVYQGKLFWRYHDGRWYWDFADSLGAEFSGLQEPNWTRLGDLLVLAQAFS